MKKILLLLCIFIVFCLTGCNISSQKLIAENVLSKEEVIASIKQSIKDETGDDVLVKITGIEQLERMWGTTFGNSSTNVENGRKITYQVMNANDDRFQGVGTYSDGYVIYNGETKTVIEPFIINSYAYEKNTYLFKEEISQVLSQNTEKYQIYSYDDTPRTFIFLYSPNYEDVYNCFSEIKSILGKYGYPLGINVIAFKNSESYDKYASMSDIENYIKNGYGGLRDIITVYYEITTLNSLRDFTQNVFDSTSKMIFMDTNIAIYYVPHENDSDYIFVFEY